MRKAVSLEPRRASAAVPPPCPRRAQRVVFKQADEVGLLPCLQVASSFASHLKQHTLLTAQSPNHLPLWPSSDGLRLWSLSPGHGGLLVSHTEQGHACLRPLQAPFPCLEALPRQHTGAPLQPHAASSPPLQHQLLLHIPCHFSTDLFSLPLGN